MSIGARAKSLARSLMPPLLRELVERVRPAGNTWTGDYASFAEARAASGSYADDSILERVVLASKKVDRGEFAYERDGVVFDDVEYAWPLLATLLWVAARHGARLNVLDFGGALGSSYRQNRLFLHALKEVRWNVVEQPHFVRAGREHFANETLRFYDSVEACLAENSPHLAVVSSVLQYLEKPMALLPSLSRIPTLIIDQIPLHNGDRDRLTVQTVPASIYPAKYPCWLFSAPRLRAVLAEHYALVTDFDSHLGQEITAGTLRASYKGLILERRDVAG